MQYFSYSTAFVDGRFGGAANSEVLGKSLAKASKTGYSNTL